LDPPVSDVLGAEVVEALELELDANFVVFVLADGVGDLEDQARLGASQDFVERVTIDLDKFPARHRRQRLRRIPGKVSHHTDHERQFLRFDRITLFQVVGNLNSRSAYARELVLYACPGHGCS